MQLNIAWIYFLSDKNFYIDNNALAAKHGFFYLSTNVTQDRLFDKKDV